MRRVRPHSLGTDIQILRDFASILSQTCQAENCALAHCQPKFLALRISNEAIIHMASGFRAQLKDMLLRIRQCDRVFAPITENPFSADRADDALTRAKSEL